MSNRPIAIDLFSGCGGMSLGLEAAGFDIAASVEIDPIHSLAHHYNFPYGATICQDISQVKSEELLKAIANRGLKPDVDVLAGGPPYNNKIFILFNIEKTTTTIPIYMVK